MHDETLPNGSQSPKPEKKKKRGNRTLTIIFYTLYCLLIVSFLAGLYFVNIRLEEDLTQYEESHITVQAETTFQELFADPDWASLYEMAGIEDTDFEDVNAYISHMEATVGSNALIYEEAPKPAEGYDYLVLHNGLPIGSFRMTDQREQGARWPSWQLESLSLEFSRDITVRIRKLDDHTVTVNGIPLDDSYTIQIDTLLSEEYTLPGTTGISTELQQVSGLLVTPEIGILDADGTPCNLVIDPETGIYEEQLPEAVPLTSKQERIALETANAWGAYKLRGASAGNLSLYFDSRENAYQTLLAESFWLEEPSGYTVESVDILASQVYNDAHFSAYVSFTANINGTESQLVKSATFFFQLRRGNWTCYEIQPGSVYTEIAKVKLEFFVDNTEVYYDFYETDRTAFYAPLVTVPEGFAFAGWGTEDGQIIFTPDETGLVSLSQGTVLEPMALHAIFEPTQGGN